MSNSFKCQNESKSSIEENKLNKYQRVNTFTLLAHLGNSKVYVLPVKLEDNFIRG